MLSAVFADRPGHPDAGAAYVFENPGEGWVEVQKLVLDEPQDADNFGGPIVIAGDTAVIGAPGRYHSEFGAAGAV